MLFSVLENIAGNAHIVETIAFEFFHIPFPEIPYRIKPVPAFLRTERRLRDRIKRKPMPQHVCDVFHEVA